MFLGCGSDQMPTLLGRGSCTGQFESGVISIIVFLFCSLESLQRAETRFGVSIDNYVPG